MTAGRNGVLGIVVAALVVATPTAAAGRHAASGTTIVVTSTADVAAPVDGTCTLRAAITAANTDGAVGGCPAGNGADTIVLGAHVYSLALQNNSGEDQNATGDLDITAPVTITGQGATMTYVHSDSALDRVFDVHDTTATIERLNVLHGSGLATQFENGAGIRNAGTLTIRDATLFNNGNAGNGHIQYGAGVASTGTLTLDHVDVSYNYSHRGAGVYSTSALTITGSTFTNNKADGGGAIYASGPTSISDTTVSSNFGSQTSPPYAPGGGIYVAAPGTLTLQGSTVDGNLADHRERVNLDRRQRRRDLRRRGCVCLAQRRHARGEHLRLARRRRQPLQRREGHGEEHAGDPRRRQLRRVDGGDVAGAQPRVQPFRDDALLLQSDRPERGSRASAAGLERRSDEDEGARDRKRGARRGRGLRVDRPARRDSPAGKRLRHRRLRAAPALRAHAREGRDGNRDRDELSGRDRLRGDLCAHLCARDRDADAEPGKRIVFAGWSGNCTGLGPCVLTMTSAHAVTATFTAFAAPPPPPPARAEMRRAACRRPEARDGQAPDRCRALRRRQGQARLLEEVRARPRRLGEAACRDEGREGKPRRARREPWSAALERRELGKQAVDLVGRVVVDDPRTHGPVREAEALHHLDRVVVPVPDGVAAVAEALGRLGRG